MDKNIATILGRPPLINRGYCTLDAPLDFDDDHLTGPQLQEELKKIDQNGWNTDGRRRSTTYMRLRYLLATVREEALELYLGVDSTALTSRAQSVHIASYLPRVSLLLSCGALEAHLANKSAKSSGLCYKKCMQSGIAVPKS